MTAKKKLSWDDIKKRRERATVPVKVPLNQQLDVELERLNDELKIARFEDQRHKDDLDWAPRSIEIAERILKLEAERELPENQVEFVMGEVPRGRWNELLRAHGPTAAQRKEGVTNFNPETFTPAAIAESAVEPELTEEEAQELCDQWGEGVVRQLFDAVLVATMGSQTRPKSQMASEVMREFGAGSEPPSDSDVPLPSSTDA